MVSERKIEKAISLFLNIEVFWTVNLDEKKGLSSEPREAHKNWQNTNGGRVDAAVQEFRLFRCGTLSNGVRHV
jgi:hypothetical protein